MSFSGNVKEELSKRQGKSRCCQLAELSAMLVGCGCFEHEQARNGHIQLQTESLPVARKVFTLLKKTFTIEVSVSVAQNPSQKRLYTIFVPRPGDVAQVLQGLGEKETWESLPMVNPQLLQKTCCRRAFVRGTFLAAGSMSDPQKAYHFEIVCKTEVLAKQLREVICSFGMDAKIVLRKKSHVVYLKEGEQIVDLLNVMEAHNALMELENVRILKEMRNTVNRKVNCETANIHKTVSAAVKQMAAIRYLQQTIGLERIPQNLREVALLRLEYPEASLKELGQLMSEPVGKSGINHRLKKIGELAEDMRIKQGGESE